MKRSSMQKVYVRPPRVLPAVPAEPPPPRSVMVRIDGKARAVVAVPKRAYVRSKTLREAFRLIPCQFELSASFGAICNAGGAMCCHSNWGTHGKGRGIKADDSRAAAGCVHHHGQLDQGKSWTEPEKQALFWAAHVRSVRLLVALGHWPESVPVPDIEKSPWETA